MKKGIWALVMLATLACSRPDDQETGSVEQEDMEEARSEISAAARAALDSGNAAYKAKDYDRARAHYNRVTQLEKDAPAGWFGIYMTEQARGNAAAADSALGRAQKHAPGASLLRTTND
jgi:tetratricopeptide (TPR) repeat protein